MSQGRPATYCLNCTIYVSLRNGQIYWTNNNVNQDNSILFEDLWAVKTPPLMDGYTSWLVVGRIVWSMGGVHVKSLKIE